MPAQSLMLPLAGSLAYHATIGLSFTLVLLQAQALGGARAVGLVVGVPMFMMVGSSAFWGAMADRWRNRKRVVLLAIVLSSLLALPMPLAGAGGEQCLCCPSPSLSSLSLYLSMVLLFFIFINY